MNFKDFNDEGPGTFEWDYVLGGNTTGLFLEETHFEVDGNTLLEVIFRHTGGNKFEPAYGDNWDIENISEMKSSRGTRSFTFDQGRGHFRATVNEKLSAKYGLVIVDLVELCEKDLQTYNLIARNNIGKISTEPERRNENERQQK